MQKGKAIIIIYYIKLNFFAVAAGTILSCKREVPRFTKWDNTVARRSCSLMEALGVRSMEESEAILTRDRSGSKQASSKGIAIPSASRAAHIFVRGRDLGGRSPRTTGPKRSLWLRKKCQGWRVRIPRAPTGSRSCDLVPSKNARDHPRMRKVHSSSRTAPKRRGASVAQMGLSTRRHFENRQFINHWRSALGVFSNTIAKCSKRWKGYRKVILNEQLSFSTRL